jgi:hypothetical protein
MLNILSLLLAVSQRCTSYLNPPNLKFPILIASFVSQNTFTQVLVLKLQGVFV